MELIDAEKWLNEHIAELEKTDEAVAEADSKLAEIHRVLALFDAVATGGTIPDGLLDDEVKFLRSEHEKAHDYLEACKQEAAVAHKKLTVIEPIRDRLQRKK